MQSWQAASFVAVMVFTSLATAQEAKQELPKRLMESARRVFELNLQRQRGWFDFEDRNRWSRRWLEAQLELADTKEKRTSAYEDHLKRMRKCDELAKTMFDAGKINQAERATCEYFLIQAELWLERAKQGPPKAG